MTPRPNRQRLTIFSGAWLPNEGGAEKQLRQIAEDLTAAGWQITVITGSGRAESAVEEQSGISVARIRPLLREGDPPVGGELMARAVLAGLRTRPTLVLCSLVSGASLAGMTVARLLRVPCVLRIGGHDLDRHLTSRVGRTQGSYLVNGSSAIVINAEHLRQQIKPFAKSDALVVLIRNGVAPGLPPSGSSDASEGIRIAYYTNGGQAKNDPDFVRVVRHCPGISFRAMGSTAHLPDLPNLTRLGWVDPVDQELQCADVALNTSTSEGSPNFCMQALANGTPVVGFDNGGLVDLANRYPSDVRVVAQGDVSALAAVLLEQDWRVHTTSACLPTRRDAAAQWDDLLSGLIQGD